MTRFQEAWRVLENPDILTATHSMRQEIFVRWVAHPHGWLYLIWMEKLKGPLPSWRRRAISR